MDSLNDPANKRVVFMKSAQIGATEILNNAAGFYAEQDASPILVVQPTTEMGEAWSKDRLSPMIRDTPELARIFGSKARNSGSTITHKTFPGGHLTVAGANSPASLASRPVRCVFLDEVDRYPGSAGSEGDPVMLAIKRANNFWNRRVYICSTPTIKGFSRIEKEWEKSDKRRFHVPCPHCDHEHHLQWANVRWGEDTPAQGDPAKAMLQCPDCEGFFSNAQKNEAGRVGRWIATADFTGIAGFHVNELYSPWKSVGDVASEFLQVKGDPSQLQVWVNTSLGETWEDSGETVNEHDLFSHCEKYPAELPRRVLILTAGIDTQPDRLECEVVGWAGGEESWSIDYHVFHGDPDIPEGQSGSPWTGLTDHLRRAWKHESGVELTVAASCVDSGGHNTQAVYNYAKRHRGMGVFAIKGQGGEGLPIVGSPMRRRSGKKTKRPTDVYMVGTDPARLTVMRRLKINEPGPGYCHFPEGRTLDYFRQLSVLKAVTKYVKGFARIEWRKAEGHRAEAFDCRVYAFAGLMLASPMFDKLAFRMKKRIEELTAKPKKAEPDADHPLIDRQIPAQDQPSEKLKGARERSARRRRGGFVNSWK